MKPSHKFFAKVLNGRLQHSNIELFNSSIRSMDGKEVEIVIKERTRKKTLSQIAYYRGVILQACYASEYFSHCDKADDIHDDYFADKFLSYKKIVTLPDGKKKEITKYISMADMSVKECSEFIEKVLAHCQTEFGIEVLDPQSYYSKYYSK